jgi:hypothetical protein
MWHTLVIESSLVKEEENNFKNKDLNVLTIFGFTVLRHFLA